MPPPLFKYLSVLAADAVLANRSLKWAAPRTFNDPFDVQTALALEVVDNVVVDRALELFAERFERPRPAANIIGEVANHMFDQGVRLSRTDVDRQFRAEFVRTLARLRGRLPSFSAELIQGLANSKLLCLSASETIVPMWAHYADNHQGIVVEFEGKAGVDSAFTTAKPVFYSPHPPSFLDQESLARVLSGSQNFEVLPTLSKIIFHKAVEWEHEREWRIWSGDGRNPVADFEYARFFRSDLSRVIFGLRVSEENRLRWERLARNINDQVVFAQISMSGDCLEAQPY